MAELVLKRELLTAEDPDTEVPLGDRTRNEQQLVGTLIVSEVRFVCEGLAEILAREKWIAILGSSASLVEAVPMTLALQPDCILLDAAFEAGLAAVRQLCDAAPRARIVALAIAETEQDIVSWVEAGVAGYIPRTAGVAELVMFLRDINNDRQPCSSGVAFSLLRRLGHANDGSRAHDRHFPASILTSRELQVGALIQAGLSNKEIARRLNIGLSTTKSHVHNLLGKLSLRCRGQVAARMSEIHHRPDRHPQE
jgi:two-component system nitrate/nitrite response regulator NarL